LQGSEESRPTELARARSSTPMNSDGREQKMPTARISARAAAVQMAS